MTTEPLSPDEQRKINPPLITPLTNSEATLADVIAKLDDYHKEDVNRSEKNRYETMRNAFYGFAVAATGLVGANSTPPITGWKILAIVVSVIAATVFYIYGTIATRKLRKYKRWNEF